MLMLKEWKKEKDTLQLISQILGKYKLECAYQEPQWAHVMLNINVKGFSTGLMMYEDKVYGIDVNLVQHQIEITVDDKTSYIDLEQGTTIQYYFAQISDLLENEGVLVKINTTPQEFEDDTPFEKDTAHCHYDPDVARKALKLLHFAYRAQLKFVSGLRTRKVKPGLFWGTFDVSCLINYNALHVMFEDHQVIEAGAFDEHFIEIGFWFGDDNYQGPTFFIFPYPFVDSDFQYDVPLPDNMTFDRELTEFVFPLKEINQQTLEDLQAFMYTGYDIFKDALAWKDCDYHHIPLKMPENDIEKREE